MKKWGILVLMMSIALHGFAGPFTVKDIPRDVEREIFNHFSGSGKERRQEVEDAKEAYVRLQNKAYDFGYSQRRFRNYHCSFASNVWN